MATLADRTEFVLDENRILIIASQFLLGFEMRAAFEPGFDRLPEFTRWVKLLGLGLALVVVGLLMLPSAYHRIVARGEDTPDLYRFTSRTLQWALLPFAFGLGVDLFVATEGLVGRSAGFAALASGVVAAFMLWYGIEIAHRRKRTRFTHREASMGIEKEPGGGWHDRGTPTREKIKQVLTELRVVLPGSQTLLGFQFLAILTDAFERLPGEWKAVHVASLGCVTLTVILLMSAPAYHRIVEEGEATERFHDFAARVLLCAMVPLGLGIAGDTAVVVRKVSGSATLAIPAGALTLSLLYGLWFGYTLLARQRAGRRETQPRVELPYPRAGEPRPWREAP